jgi:hypothetical protein
MRKEVRLPIQLKKSAFVGGASTTIRLSQMFNVTAESSNPIVDGYSYLGGATACDAYSLADYCGAQ